MAEIADVQELAHPATARKRKTKKKKRKVKLNKEQKKLAKLEKECKEFQKQKEEYEFFLNRMDKWLKDHHREALKLFGQYDSNGTGLLGHEDFKLGMRDLNIPCVEAQLHILTKLLDPGRSGTIDYAELGAGLQRARFQAPQDKDEDADDHEDEAEQTNMEMEEKEEGGQGNKGKASPLFLTNERLERCGSCHLGLCKPIQACEPRFLLVELRLITFDTLKSHPGHFQEVVECQSRVHGLMQRIRERVGIESTKLQIFRDKTFSRESYLHPIMSLEECGFHGGPLNTPVSVTLYYDYMIEFTDCPLLNCDHYFGVKKY